MVFSQLQVKETNYNRPILRKNWNKAKMWFQ